MAYRKSRPRVDLERSIDQAVQRVRSADRASIPGPLREYVYSSAIFLSHAELENYFVDVMDRLARLYSDHSTTSTSIPQQLRTFIFLSRSNISRTFVNYLASGDEHDLVRAVTGKLSRHLSVFADGTTPPVAITGADLTGRLTYPSTANLEQVLRRLGVGDPKGHVNRIARRDVWSLLESISSLRTALAHSASLPGISGPDVVVRLRGLQQFVAALDRALYAHVRTTHAGSAWSLAMP